MSKEYKYKGQAISYTEEYIFQYETTYCSPANIMTPVAQVYMPEIQESHFVSIPTTRKSLFEHGQTYYFMYVCEDKFNPYDGTLVKISDGKKLIWRKK